MFRLKRSNETKNYHGFILKKGFWYGINTETNAPIASSGWEAAGNVAIYTLHSNKWHMEWYSIEETVFYIENIPDVNTTNKMPFYEWLNEEIGISRDDWDENYSESAARQIEEEYDYYLYDNLPRFVQKYL